MLVCGGYIETQNCLLGKPRAGYGNIQVRIMNIIIDIKLWSLEKDEWKCNLVICHDYGATVDIKVVCFLNSLFNLSVH